MIVLGSDNILVRGHIRIASLPLGAMISVERLLSISFVILRMADLACLSFSGLSGSLTRLSSPLTTRVFRLSWWASALWLLLTIKPALEEQRNVSVVCSNILLKKAQRRTNIDFGMTENRLRILSPSQNRTCEHHLAYGSSSSNNLSVKANCKFAKFYVLIC